MASTPQEFVDRALAAGYTKEDIQAFLQQAGKMENKEKQAMEIIKRQPDNPDPQSQRILNEATGELSSGGGGISGALGTAAKYALPVAAGVAAGAPMLAAAKGAMGVGSEALGAGVAGASAGSMGEALGNVLTRPTGKEAVSLFNTARKRGVGQALAQFGSQQAKGFAQRQQGQPQGQPAQEEFGLPQPIAEYAMESFQNIGDLDTTAFEVSQDILSPGHPLNNLAKTYVQRSGGNLREAIAQYLASQSPQMAGQGAENPESDLSQVPTSDLMALAKQLGIL